jgi:hypothetical protein
VGYDEDAQTMEIEFKEGRVYQYFDVPKHVYHALMQADSRGQYFHQSIRGFYRYARV